jgi:hypothetical protein
MAVVNMLSPVVVGFEAPSYPAAPGTESPDAHQPAMPSFNAKRRQRLLQGNRWRVPNRQRYSGSSGIRSQIPILFMSGI